MLNIKPNPDLTILELADFLHELPDNDDAEAEAGFDMQISSLGNPTNHPCGTAACIGGWANALTGERGSALTLFFTDRGIDYIEANDLCFPYDYPLAWHATPQQAARAVRIIGETGKCDWPAALAGDET